QHAKGRDPIRRRSSASLWDRSNAHPRWPGSSHPPGLQTKALRRVGRVERPRGLIAAWVCACCAQRRRPTVALTKPPQHGVDVFGSKNGLSTAYFGVQCKGKDQALGARATVRELEGELIKADKFEPPLAHWTFVT